MTAATERSIIWAALRRPRTRPRPSASGGGLSLRALLDERDPSGGRVKGAVFLLHPGPSLLTSAVMASSSALLASRGERRRAAALAVAIALPAQLGTGALNDLCDRRADAVGKPHKPLCRGAATPRQAALATVAGTVVSLTAAARGGRACLAVDLLGLAAGMGSDVGLKRGATSWMPMWGGIAAVALAPFAVAGTAPRALGWTVALSGTLGLALSCANGLPDIAPDLAAGTPGLPALLGERRTAALMTAASITTAAGALVVSRRVRAGRWRTTALVGGALVHATTTTAAAAAARRGRTSLAFPLTAAGAVPLGLAWMACLAANRT